MSLPRILLIVPTLGTRVGFLRQSLESITSQDTPAEVVVVCPKEATEARDLARLHHASIVDDPGSLPRAINAGARQLQPHHEFINWLGDDDLLEPRSLTATALALDDNPNATVAFGACRYINEHNKQLWVSRAGKWASWILSWGPDLVPQPGMLVRAKAWNQVEGVDESLTMAFDLDLLLKLKQLGPLVNCNQILASFRWHSTSLTAADRSTNVVESEQVKRRYLSPTQRKLRWSWEGPVRLATKVAAREVQRRATSGRS